MITKEELNRLAARHSDSGIVSVYIKVDPHLGYQHAQPAMKFKGAYSRARREADERTLAILEREHDRILAFLEGWTQSGRGLAIFASEPDDFWETHPLDVMVPSYVTVANEPDTQFLVQILDETPRMAVLLLDGGDARLYLGEQGAMGEVSRHSEELPSRHAQGGWSQARFQRHVDFHHSKVLREMADQVTSLFYKKDFDRLVLVGVDSATKELESMLSDPIRQRVIGHLPADSRPRTIATSLCALARSRTTKSGAPKSPSSTKSSTKQMLMERAFSVSTIPCSRSSKARRTRWLSLTASPAEARSVGTVTTSPRTNSRRAPTVAARTARI